MHGALVRWPLRGVIWNPRFRCYRTPPIKPHRASSESSSSAEGPSHTFIAGSRNTAAGSGVRSVRSPRWAHAWQAHRETAAHDQGIRPAAAWKTSSSAPGPHSRDATPPRSTPACSTSTSKSSHRTSSRASSPCGRLRPVLREAPERHQRQTGKTKLDLAELIRKDIATQSEQRLRRLVMVWAASTEISRGSAGPLNLERSRQRWKETTVRSRFKLYGYAP